MGVIVGVLVGGIWVAVGVGVLVGMAVGRITCQADLSMCQGKLKACRQALTQRDDELMACQVEQRTCTVSKSHRGKFRARKFLVELE